ncbi:MAG TPA: DUF1735 domain-containing protein [Mariniphaga sp.]|nr:DUF1735 domain-containing protein [Mariniphaga sp.]
MKRYFSFLILFLVTAGLSSCLKDEAVLDPSGSKNIIEFYNVTAPTSGVTAPYVMYVPTTLEVVPEVEFDIAISYSGAELEAPQDIVVNLAEAPEAVTAFNASQGTSYVQMGASGYEFPSSVTIRKGEKRVYAKVKVRPTILNQAVSNVLALTITSASFGEISGNFRTVIFSLPIKSIWEGTYTYTVTNNFGTIDGNIGGVFTEQNVRLSTVGPNRLYMQYLWRTYSGYSEYQFNADNTDITSVLAFSGSVLSSSIEEVILIDTENLIFEIRWVGLGRGVIERFVRTGD